MNNSFQLNKILFCSQNYDYYNVRSLTPKIEEVQEFLNRNDITMAFITETWLKPTIMDSVISIPGYTVLISRWEGDYRFRSAFFSNLRSPISTLQNGMLHVSIKI
jgi:hypothetical protein